MIPPHVRSCESGEPSVGLFASGSFEGPEPYPCLEAAFRSESVSEEADGMSPCEALGSVLCEASAVLGALLSLSC